MMQLDLDTAREVLADHIFKLFAYKCTNPACGAEFYCHNEEADLCPYCGFAANLQRDVDVELLDWGIRR